MIGYRLTAEEALQIDGKYFAENQSFKPIQDINGDWFIFEGEVNGHITNSEFDWVKDLQPSEYIAPIINNEL
jgi:hypothetical protein